MIPFFPENETRKSFSLLKPPKKRIPLLP